MARFLLIDNSNTRTKFALGGAEKLDAWRAHMPTADITGASLAELLDPLEFDAALVASVVPIAAETLGQYLSKRATTHFLTHQSNLGVEIDFPDPSQLGADRLANAIGVEARHGSPAIVIDFGTAVTFDVISSAPAYCGGAIAPGLGAMTGYLFRRTALLPQIDITEPPHAIGKTTEEAMRSGAVFGYRGLIRGILDRLRPEIDGTPVVVATGGDAPVIAEAMPEIDHIDPDLTLDGLRLAALRNLR
jgi:type III pantothenate kinase